MIYFGSGAEYRFDDYGMAKGVMNGYTKLTKHIYNLRVYGCFGEGEKESRFITTCINEKHKGGEVIISKDSAFSYVYIKDLCKAVKVILDNKPKSQDYTIVGDEVRRLSEIADMVGVENKVIESSGEYFSNSEKFKTEFNFKFTPLEEAIREYEKSF
jgi:GDP-L-fucose synthase